MTGAVPAFGPGLQTNEIWRANRDPNLVVNVDATKLRVTVGSFNADGRAIARVTGSDWLVHGTVMLQMTDNGVSIQSETYSFEPHDNQFFRNMETIVGFLVASKFGTQVGTDFRFNFIGSPVLSASPSYSSPRMNRAADE